MGLGGLFMFTCERRTDVSIVEIDDGNAAAGSCLVERMDCSRGDWNEISCVLEPDGKMSKLASKFSTQV